MSSWEKNVDVSIQKYLRELLEDFKQWTMVRAGVSIRHVEKPITIVLGFTTEIWVGTDDDATPITVSRAARQAIERAASVVIDKLDAIHNIEVLNKHLPDLILPEIEEEEWPSEVIYEH